MNEVNETELTNNQQLIQFKLLLCCIVNFTICNYFTIAIHNHGLTLATHMESDPEVGLGIVWVQLSPKVTSRIHSPIYITLWNRLPCRVNECGWKCALHKVAQDEVAERLRRWTANPLCSARVGSNPILVGQCLWMWAAIIPNDWHVWAH